MVYLSGLDAIICGFPSTLEWPFSRGDFSGWGDTSSLLSSDVLRGRYINEFSFISIHIITLGIKGSDIYHLGFVEDSQYFRIMCMK